MAAPTFTARLYSLLFRRTSTFALTIAVGALFFERAFDQGADAIYEHINQGIQHSSLSKDSHADIVVVTTIGRQYKIRELCMRILGLVTLKLWKHIKHKYENKE
ncbi:cytochrome b-c1 complex subunit 9 isoform X1 [Canis lupus familiaris]|uniref:Cytochrome b-c1 complex subunit 9 n=1 Tax=Canis lupus familiaris TaxID=9615 RepID=A0A8P0TJ14_CANLF|nr:cytochrome b-c1 complex subunit 9 isoform X1 [Canis lupus dingo]XP_038293122.1 cytochrome b-c1 complex subunit 9 isoform X1 [Canis lupus familiaris]XP_038315077.1 cytochrome b-c1 complex subunit 9 isoform X1 [Canis lupus familiaris]XP_038431526.1 cytochrome b-c1 complex subunit 9 isoform X1 [Canis lupus familiaris]